jgi:hypothetical protein
MVEPPERKIFTPLRRVWAAVESVQAAVKVAV